MKSQTLKGGNCCFLPLFLCATEIHPVHVSSDTVVAFDSFFARRLTLDRDQREWVFEVREVKSENKKLSLFFEKCKVKKNAFTLFREVQSEIKMLSLFFEK